MATTDVKLRPGRFSGKRLRVAITSSANQDEINAALGEIYKLSGCEFCGRNGYDIILTHGDPVLENFRVPRVSGVIVEDIQTRV
jgi:hypothetical protein